MKRPGYFTLSRLCIAVVCCFTLLAAIPSYADGIPAFSFTSATFATYDSNAVELGYFFTTGSEPITVGALGYINDGFDATHTVAIFDAATQQIVAGAFAAVTTIGGSSSSTNFTYTDLSDPVVLAANTEYQIISQAFINEHYFTQAQGLISQPGVTMGAAAYGFYNSLPNTIQFAGGSTSATYPGDFGPNFTIVDTTPVPEPSSIYLMVSGLLGAGVAFRRHIG